MTSARAAFLPVLAFLLPISILTAAPPAAAPTAPAGAGAAFRPPAAESLVAAEVDVQRMEQTVRDLVRLGPRMGGTPSGGKAAAFLAAAFRSAGLAVQEVDDPVQPAHWESSWEVELEGGGRVEGAGGVEGARGVGAVRGLGGPGGGAAGGAGEAGVLVSAYPYGFSPSVGPLAAPIVAVEGGEGLRALAKAPHAAWKGAILFVHGELRGAYLDIATSPDAPAAILTDAPGDGQVYRDSARLSALPPVPGGGARPLAVFGVSFADGQRVAAAAAGGRRAHVELRSTVGEGRPRTVIATLPGRDAERYYLICAHGDSDSGGPGADDNASGEAVVVELARLLAGLVRSGRLAQPRVALRFAVWGSEYASSEAYVAREGATLARCQGVINLDEVGTGAEREAIYFESNEVPWNGALLHTFDAVGRDYLGRPGFWPEYTTNPSQGGTDSYAFLPKTYQGVMKGDLHVPSTTVYTAAWDHLGKVTQTPGWETTGTPDPVHLAIDYSRYYHSSGDTPENTTDRQPQAMERAARAIGIALNRLVF